MNLSSSECELFMEMALGEAQIAFADGAVPVGAIIIDTSDQITAKSHNTLQTPTCHAEIQAINEACRKLNRANLQGCTIFSTLEPCIMCAGAILNAHIDYVFFGAWDDKFGASGSTWDLLRDPRAPYHPEVFAGVLENKCSQILTRFFKKLRG